MARLPQNITPTFSLQVRITPELREQIVALIAKDSERWPTMSAVGVEALTAFIKRYNG